AFQVRTDGTALFGSHTNQLSHSILIKNLERINFQNLLFQVNRQERSDIIARITEGHLCQVICSEGKELGRRSDTVCSQCGTRNFYHCTNLEVDTVSHFLEQLCGCFTDYFFLFLEFV